MKIIQFIKTDEAEFALCDDGRVYRRYIYDFQPEADWKVYISPSQLNAKKDA
jgi:hypothetical protein